MPASLVDNIFKVEMLYHKGQKNIWDGKQYLQECIDKHGEPSLPSYDTRALTNIFGIILLGELAAWKISSAIAITTNSDEVRMAATSQAHDEARHFYVMRDYLSMLGPVPDAIEENAESFLESVLSTPSEAKMILGMQLMVEPMALTLFKVVREKNIDPVLSDLLSMFEKDEARHVALGTMYLPKLLSEMSLAQKADLLTWQFFGYMKQFKMLKALEEDFATLGIPVREIFLQARKKQVLAMDLLSEELGEKYPLMDLMLKVIDFRNEMTFPTDPKAPFANKLKSALTATLAEKG